MFLTANPKIVEDLMCIFRKEGARRHANIDVPGNTCRFTNNLNSVLNSPMAFTPLSRFPARDLEFPVKKSYVISEFLNFHDETFIRNAYRGILDREPDANGLAHYLTALRSGQYTKTEILGRLRYSKEGKAHAVRVRGLFIPFAFHMACQIPILGYLIAWINFILRLPSVVRNWSRFEAFVAFQHHHQLSYLNQLVDQAEHNLRQISITCEQKADREECTNLRFAVEERALLSSLQQAQVELRSKAEQNEVSELRDLLASKADLNQLASIESSLLVLGENTEDALHQIRNKVDAELLADLVRAMEVKAERVDLEVVHRQVIESLEAKVDRTDLEAIRNTLDAKADIQLIDEWNGRLETRVPAEQLANLTDQISVSGRQTLASIEEIRRQILDHRRNIVDQQRRLTLLLEEVRKHLHKPIDQAKIKPMLAEEDHLLDAFYVSFEDCFRGTREDIKQRMEVYIPIIKEARVGDVNAPILDIGCGRGEWLELLKNTGLIARGVDLNRIMVRECRELGLEVIEADAINYLRDLDANSVGAVTGMHIIEHIPFKRLIALFDEVLRTLKPGGVAIFETPNPENLVTGACNFYFDPTHLNPLPPDSMRFVMEIRGYSRIEIMRLHPCPEEMLLIDGPTQMRQLINEKFFGAQDYALVAYKV